MQIQLRDDDGGLMFFESVSEAMDFANSHKSVWKVSYTDSDGRRVRLIRQPDSSWLNVPIL